MAAQVDAASRPPARRLPLRTLVTVTLLSLLLALSVTAAIALVSAARASDQYSSAHRALLSDLAAAHALGYEDSDLAQVTTDLGILEASAAPALFGRREFYERQSGFVSRLRGELMAAEASALAAYQGQADSVLGDAEQAARADQSGDLDPADLAAAEANIPALKARLLTATTPASLEQIIKGATAALNRLNQLGADQAAENKDIAAAAQTLIAKHGGKLDEIRTEGAGSLAAARNDGTVAAYLKLPGDDRNVRRLETYGGRIGAGDVNQVATAAAGVERYQSAIHDYLTGHMPAKVIIVSLDAQQLTTFEGGRVALDTPVTTGKPELATDTGAMKVLWKQAPWKMHSPWPRGSPYWYPDTLVQKVVWFTNTGEGLHDAYWEPRSAYGRGSEFGRSASHGCIHVPDAEENSLYDWAAVGTPVIVYPGNGTPVAAQLKQSTVDDNGQPTTGPKGA